MDAQLKRGILNICILKLLEEDSKYGYELVKTILVIQMRVHYMQF